MEEAVAEHTRNGYLASVNLMALFAMIYAISGSGILPPFAG